MSPPRRSKIGYTDYSGNDLNFVLGCTPVSEGCRFCYGKAIYDRFGKDFSKVTIYPEKLKHLLKWQPKPPYKRGPGSRPLAFVVDMGDLFHEEIPHYFIQEFLDEVVYGRLDIDWQVLTKRPRRMWREVQIWYRRMAVLSNKAYSRWNPLPNLWLGVTVEDEDNLWRIRHLLNTPAAVRWVSYEPALSPIDLTPYLPVSAPHFEDMGFPRTATVLRQRFLSWIVIGAESGPNRRPFKKEWAWDIVDRWRKIGLPVFLKQDSGLRPGMPLLDREGRAVKEWPDKRGGG